LWTLYLTFGFHNSADLLTSWRTASFSRKFLFHCVTKTIRLDHASVHAWCVSTLVWCAVGARFWSCEFVTTSDPCPTLHGCSRPGYSTGVAHATAKQRYTCSKNIYYFRSRSLVHYVALRTFWNERCCASVRNPRLNSAPWTKK
jgi:hypothetical protein